MNNLILRKSQPCPTCHGKGQAKHMLCPKCLGTGSDVLQKAIARATTSVRPTAS